MTQPPHNSNQKLPIILLITAVFPPAAAAFTFAEQFTNNPWQTAGWVALYWSGIFIFGSITKIWQRLEKGWLDSIANWVDAFVRRLISGYKKRYLQHVIYRQRSFDVKGLPTQGPFNLMLEQVFVELSLAEQPAHSATSNPVGQIPEGLRTGRHTIWEYLASSQAGVQHLAIIGAPGSGKSTLLKHLALILAAPHRRSQEKAPKLLPILLAIRDHSAAIDTDAKLSLPQAIVNDLARTEGPSAPPQWFERQLAKGQCLILLDGLDEVADQNIRKKVAEWIERQMRAHGKNRFIITSRPLGYQSAPLSGVSVVAIRPFTPPQVQRFVHNWYLANELMSSQKDDPGVRMTARQGSEDLLQRLRNAPTLAELAVNPLLLTMIANVHRYRSSLPGRRVELYAEICEVFLGKRRQAHGLDMDLTPAQKQSVLQVLAYHLMSSERRELPLEDILPLIEEPLALVRAGLRGEAFLKQIEEGSGLLLEREREVYSFAHLTFQEYLAAAYIREHNLEQVLVDQVDVSWWRETILLYVAQADATPIVATCLNEARSSVAALTLALDCREEAKLLQRQLREQLARVEAEGAEDQDATRRALIAEVILSRRIRHMLRIDEQRYVDPGFITCAEYQLFLDGQHQQGTCYRPDHWESDHFLTGRGLHPIVGVRPSDVKAFCVWLTGRDQNGWHYRLPRIDDALPNLVSQDEVGYWVENDPHGYRLDNLALKAQSLQLILSLGWANDIVNLALLTIFDPANPLTTILFATSTENRVLATFIALDFDHLSDLDHVLDRANALDIDRALDRAFALAFALAHTSTFNYDSERALDRASALILALALALALTLASASAASIAALTVTVPASTFDRAQSLIHASDLAFTRVLAFARNLARTSALASDLGDALARASDNALDPNRNRYRARNLALVLDRVLNLVLERNSDQASAFYHALNDARDLARDLARTFAFVTSEDLIRVLGLTVTITSVLSLYYPRVGENIAFLSSTQVEALWHYSSGHFSGSRSDELLNILTAELKDGMVVVDLDYLSVVVQELDRTRNNAQEVEFLESWSHGTDQSEAAGVQARGLLEAILAPYTQRIHIEAEQAKTSAFQWAARLVLLVLINILSAQLPEKSLLTRFIPRNETERTLQERIKAYARLYIQLSVLESRRGGELPAVEGIRIVKEYRPE
jgi:energy-coupling factor transporter ATP-binding protein EcfA2